MAQRIANKPWPKRDALARAVTDPNRGETNPPVSRVCSRKRDAMLVLGHMPCEFGCGAARRVEKKRHRVAHHEIDCERALRHLRQFVDEEPIGLLACHRVFRQTNGANDVVLCRAQLDCRRARDHILCWFESFLPALLNPAKNPDLGRDWLCPGVAERDRRCRAGRHDLQKNGRDLQGRGRGAACGDPAGEQKDAEGARYFCRPQR
jgi:hypothetical protein